MTAKTYEPFKKRLTFGGWDATKNGAIANIDIEFTSEGRLSISGDVREFGRYGNASAGQCQDLMLELFPESKRLYEIWERWHLNDMRAGCEHQRAAAAGAWNPSKVLGFKKYALKYEMLKKQNELKERALADAQMDRSEKSSFNKRERELLKAPYSIEVPADYVVNTTLYELKSDDTKTAGWVRPDEHPGGILAKPCDVCGYKYGTKWLFEEVPAEIIEELRSMK